MLHNRNNENVFFLTCNFEHNAKFTLSCRLVSVVIFVIMTVKVWPVEIFQSLQWCVSTSVAGAEESKGLDRSPTWGCRVKCATNMQTLGQPHGISPLVKLGRLSLSLRSRFLNGSFHFKMFPISTFTGQHSTLSKVPRFSERVSINPPLRSVVPSP